MKSTPAIVIVIVMAGALDIAGGTEDRRVVDPEVHAAARGGTIRVVVELRAPRNDSVALQNVEDEVLRRLAGTGARVARRYATTPLLAMEVDAAALARLEEMPDLVMRVRADDLARPHESSGPRR